MLKQYIRIIPTVLFLFISTLAWSKPPASAAEFYDAGQYPEAINIYESLIHSGSTNASLFYNLGNAYYRTGARGKAMAALLTAKRLMPRDPDIKANLKYIHEQNVDKLHYQNTDAFWNILLFWQNSLNLKELWQCFLILWCLGFTLMIPVLWQPSWTILNRIGLGAILGASIFLLAFISSLQLEEKWGAVSAAKARIFSGPGGLNTIVFELHEGAPFIVKKKQQSWLQIELSDGKKGWIANSDASFFDVSLRS